MIKKIYILLFVVITLMSFAYADGKEEAYVICMPNDQVNIRINPSRSSAQSGFCEPGDKIYLDGKKRNGFLHCVDLSTERGEGWIYKGYVSYEEPVYVNQEATITSKGRLAARSCINGKRSRWLKTGATLKVYYWTNTWSATNCGYIQSKYLELHGF